MFIAILLVILLAFAGGMGVTWWLFLFIDARHRLRLSPEERQTRLQLLSTLTNAWCRSPRLQVFGGRLGLVGAPIIASILYASIVTAQPSLRHIDPVIFSALQMALLLPVSLALLCFTYHRCPPLIVRQGLLGGLPLGISFVCVELSLRSLGIIPMAMLMALDGVIASGISWLILRQRQSLYTCAAVGCAGCGAFLLWWAAPGFWQADLLALGAGLLFTMYAFHVERSRIVCGPLTHIGGFLGGMLGSLAVGTLSLALCFGWWPSLRSFSGVDLDTLLYTSLAAVLIPVTLSTISLRRFSAVSLAFFALLEPVVGIAFAYAGGSVPLTFFGWLGVGFIFLSVLAQAASAAVSPLSTATRGNKRAQDTSPSAECTTKSDTSLEGGKSR